MVPISSILSHGTRERELSVVHRVPDLSRREPVDTSEAGPVRAMDKVTEQRRHPSDATDFANGSRVPRDES
jgi:hypothetical protein